MAAEFSTKDNQYLYHAAHSFKSNIPLSQLSKHSKPKHTSQSHFLSLMPQQPRPVSVATSSTGVVKEQPHDVGKLVSWSVSLCFWCREYIADLRKGYGK